MADASVDVVHARFAYFFPYNDFDPTPGLIEVGRVLKPGGRLVVIDNDTEEGEFAQLLNRPVPQISSSEKGATSGHTQRVRSVRLDCDGDTVLLQVEQVGGACHTGDRTCFDARVLLGDA